MSDNELIGSFQVSMANLQKLLQWTHAPFDERYDKAYINVSGEEIRTISNAGESVSSYCDFSEPFINDIILHDEIDEEAGMEAVVKIPQVQNYLSFVGGDTVSIEFFGDPEEGRAVKMGIEGDLRADMYIPSSRSDYESIQLAIVKLYDEDNNWIRQSTGEKLQTSFTTECSEFRKIIDIVDFDSFALSNYPIVIEDGEWLLDASDENDRDSISGSLYAENVEGPDVMNYYSRGFDELFNNLNGEVDVQVEDSAPMSVVRESNDSAICCRYSMLHTEDI